MKISEICEKTGFTASTIRFYEKQNLIRNITKDKSGVRNFSEEDLNWIKFLVSMKSARLSISEMMKYAELYYGENESFEARLKVTEECREKLNNELKQIEEGIKFLDYKIEYYKKRVTEERIKNGGR